MDAETQKIPHKWDEHLKSITQLWMEFDRWHHDDEPNEVLDPLAENIGMQPYLNLFGNLLQAVALTLEDICQKQWRYDPKTGEDLYYG